MELLNISFAILVIKIAISVVPVVVGFVVFSMDEDAKHRLRDRFCSKVFGSRNAISYDKFVFNLYLCAAVLVGMGLLFGLVLVVRPYLL